MSKKRCVTCNKRLGIMYFECKCGAITCSSHRDVVGHLCTYDYKKMERELLKERIEYQKTKQIEPIEG